MTEQLKTVEEVNLKLDTPTKAEDLKYLSPKLEKELTKPEGLKDIAELSSKLANVDQTNLDSADKEWLKELGSFLTDCLEDNDANKKITTQLKKLDNNTDTGVDIDESNIGTPKLTLVNGIVNLTYDIFIKWSNIKNKVTIVVWKDWTLDPKTDDIDIVDWENHYTIDDDWDGTFVLYENVTRFENKLNHYTSSNNQPFTVNKDKNKDNYDVKFTVKNKTIAVWDIPETPEETVSFTLDNTWLLDGNTTKTDAKWYTLTIDAEKGTFTLVNPVAPAKTPDAVIPAVNTEVVAPALAPVAAENVLARFKIANPSDKEIPNRYKKNLENTARNKMWEIITAITINDSDTQEIKTKKQTLIDLINTGDLTWFQKEIWTNQDGKFGPDTLKMTKKYLGIDQFPTVTNTGPVIREIPVINNNNSWNTWADVNKKDTSVDKKKPVNNIVQSQNLNDSLAYLNSLKTTPISKRKMQDMYDIGQKIGNSWLQTDSQMELFTERAYAMDTLRNYGLAKEALWLEDKDLSKIDNKIFAEWLLNKYLWDVEKMDTLGSLLKLNDSLWGKAKLDKKKLRIFNNWLEKNLFDSWWDAFHKEIWWNIYFNDLWKYDVKGFFPETYNDKTIYYFKNDTIDTFEVDGTKLSGDFRFWAVEDFFDVISNA